MKKCKQCNTEIEDQQAKDTYTLYEMPLCKECVDKEESSELIQPNTNKVELADNDTGVEDVVNTLHRSKQGRRINGIKNIQPQLCEKGHIKIGKKGKMITSSRGRQFRPPEKLDHFLITTMNRSTDDDLEVDMEVMKLLGETPQQIPVTFVYDNPNLNLMTSYAYYEGGKCKCRGDGEIAINETSEELTCDPETCQNHIDKKCKPNGILSVILTNAPSVGGVYKFRTTGWNSIRNLMSSIEFISGLTGGKLAGLPLMLTLQPKTTTIPGTNTPTTIYMVNVEYQGTLAQLIDSAKSRLVSEEKIAAVEAKAIEMLAEPETEEEIKDVEAEFYPDTYANDVNA